VSSVVSLVAHARCFDAIGVDIKPSGRAIDHLRALLRSQSNAFEDTIRFLCQGISHLLLGWTLEAVARIRI
jgi:hypothetical protein